MATTRRLAEIEKFAWLPNDRYFLLTPTGGVVPRMRIPCAKVTSITTLRNKPLKSSAPSSKEWAPQLRTYGAHSGIRNPQEKGEESTPRMQSDTPIPQCK
jgi:hypothetical protein